MLNYFFSLHFSRWLFRSDLWGHELTPVWPGFCAVLCAKQPSWTDTLIHVDTHSHTYTLTPGFSSVAGSEAEHDVSEEQGHVSLPHSEFRGAAGGPRRHPHDVCYSVRWRIWVGPCRPWLRCSHLLLLQSDEVQQPQHDHPRSLPAAFTHRHPVHI